MSRARLAGCAALSLTCFLLGALPALGETIHTTDGQRLVGELVAEGPEELVLRTAYGVLTVPRAQVARVDGRAGDAPSAPAPAAAPTPAPRPAAPAATDPQEAQVRLLLLKAKRLRQLRKFPKAIARYGELLALRPGHQEALFARACCQALAGDSAAALASLETAMRAGLTDVERFRRELDLAGLREDAGFQRLLAGPAELLEAAGADAPERIARRLQREGARARYRVYRLPGGRLAYLYPEGYELTPLRAQVERFARALQDLLLGPPPARPLYLAILAPGDARVLDAGGAEFDPGENLIVALAPAGGSLERAHALQATLARALHYQDQTVRAQAHPEWLVEGLSALYATARLSEGGGFALDPGAELARLGEAQDLPAWEELSGLSARAFAQLGPRGSAQARSLLWWLAAQEQLAAAYAELVQRPGEPLAAIAAVLNLEPAAAESAWRAWLAEQPARELPFLGLATSKAEKGLRVTYIQAESHAARVDLAVNDVLVAVDGTPVPHEAALRAVLTRRSSGDSVRLDLLRGDERIRRELILSPPAVGPIRPSRREAPYLGAAVEGGEDGLAIREVDADSPAAKAGLHVGDRVRTLDGRPATSVRGWLRALRSKRPGETWVLGVERGGKALELKVELMRLPAGE